MSKIGLRINMATFFLYIFPLFKIIYRPTKTFYTLKHLIVKKNNQIQFLNLYIRAQIIKIQKLNFFFIYV